MKLLLTLLFTLSYSFCTFAHSPIRMVIENNDNTVIYKKERKKTIILTKDNSVVMNKPFSSQSVAEVQEKLSQLSDKTNKPLYLVLDSRGGSISAGQSLIDYANALPNKVHTITLFAASMAYLTAQHLHIRYVVPSARLMSHRARISGLGGQVPGEANSRLKHIGSIVEELLKSTAKRVGVSYKSYLNSIYDELWLTAQQAVELNHADEIVNVKCDKSLNGTHNDEVKTMFGSFKVTYSNCPLIRGPLKFATQQNKSLSRKLKRFLHKTLEYRNKKYFEYTL